MSEQKQALVETLGPFLQQVAALPLDDCRDREAANALMARLEQALPADGPDARRLGDALREGVEQGWLCDRGEPSARFCRLGKATAATHDLSIDLVCLEGPARRHRHPRGEVTLGFTVDPASTGARFDDFPPGWVVMPADSTHTPTVTGPRMLLLYFLPGGAMDWNPPEQRKLRKSRSSVDRF